MTLIRNPAAVAQAFAWLFAQPAGWSLHVGTIHATVYLDADRQHREEDAEAAIIGAWRRYSGERDGLNDYTKE